MSVPNKRASLFPPNRASGKEKGTTETNNKAFRDFREQVKKGPSFHLSFLPSFLDVVKHPHSLDDRKYFLEHTLTSVSRMKEGPRQQLYESGLVRLLYNDLPHPPATALGKEHCWRTADGSFNNISVPGMGKAGTSYARSVQPIQPLPYNQLPSPRLLFDTLLKREGFVKHPAGLSSLFFAFATLVIHTVFRRPDKDEDDHKNDTSSYVDLAPLYGHNQTAQDTIRVRDGYGLIYPDYFAERRLLLLPPAVSVLLVLFNRNHNYIAKKLYEINEKGSFKDPKILTEEGKLKQDDEIFNVARLINCGWFGSVVFSDYFSCILGLVRQGNSWSLNPFGEIRNIDQSLFERGQGNVCSVEFNCLYRWHATVSPEDEKWTQGVFKTMFGEKSYDEVTVNDYKEKAKHMLKNSTSKDVLYDRFFRPLQREKNHSFKDDDLAEILHDATEQPAGAFRARGTPHVMRFIELLGIEQSRKWGVCSLNDFRKYIGLKPYESFLEWNSNPEIADAAQKLYGDIHHLELYVGLQAEEAKPVMDGAGLCPGYTISRAILSDAIALTRGDRFFTHDFTPQNLTAWGFADCQRDPNAFGFGSTLGRLFLRTLPNNFTANSVYTFFPLMTPGSMKTPLYNLNRLEDYDITRPKKQTPPRVISVYAQVREILQNNDEFTPEYVARVTQIIKGKGFYMVEGEMEQQAVVSALGDSSDDRSSSFADEVGEYFYKTTRKLIKENSFTLVGGKIRGVDIVQRVLKIVAVSWAATEVAGIKLKTNPHDEAKYTPIDLFDMLADIYSFIFLDVEKSKFMILGQKVTGHINDLIPLIKSRAQSGGVSFIKKIGTALRKKRPSGHDELVKRIQDIGRSSDQLTNTLLALMVGSTAELSLALTNMLDVYLEKRSEISDLATATITTLQSFVREALRIDPPFRGVYRKCKEKDERIFIDIYTANTNETIFPNPHSVDISRDSMANFGADGLCKSLGESLTIKIMSEVLRAILSFKNIRRAPDLSGQLKRFSSQDQLQLRYVYLDRNQLPTPWPSTLIIEYDD